MSSVIQQGTDPSFWPGVDNYENNTPVEASVLNVPIKQLTQRTDYLRNLLRDAGAPFTAVVVHGLSTPDTGDDIPNVGDIVYLDLTTSTIKKAIADTSSYDELIPESGKAAYAFGYYKSTENGNSVVIFGQVSQVNLRSMVDPEEDATPGRYYLSHRHAGKMTKYPSGPYVFIGTFITVDGTSTAYISPNHRGIEDAHLHVSCELSPKILTGEEIGSTSVEGWVLQQDGSYLYQMATGTTLANFYPPVPAQCASLVIDGIELVSTNIGGSDGVYSINPEGIVLDRQFFYPDAQASRMMFHFIRSSTGNSGVVTSLTAKEGSPIIITRCGTKEKGNTGDLDIDLDLNIVSKDSEKRGFKVFKTFEDGSFQLGPVVERVKSGPGIVIGSSDPDGEGYGVVEIASEQTISGEFDTIALQNAKEEMIGLFPYVKLLKYSDAIPSAFTSKFQVPPYISPEQNDQPPKFNIKFYASLFGFADTFSETHTTIKFTYNVLPNLYGSSYGANFKTGLIKSYDRSVVLPFPQNYHAFDPILLTNDSSLEGADNTVFIEDLFAYTECPSPSTGEVEVYPGYLVAIRIASAPNASDTNAYDSPLGFINLSWKLNPIPTSDSTEEG